jgi:hypothetical protein
VSAAIPSSAAAHAVSPPSVPDTTLPPMFDVTSSSAAATPAVPPLPAPACSTANRNMFIFYALLIASLFIFPQHLNPWKKKIEFFESTYAALKNKNKFSYYDARQTDIPEIILQRYGNKQINSEFLIYSLFKHNKPTIILFPQGEILDAFKQINGNPKKISNEIFSYKEVEKTIFFADSAFTTIRNSNEDTVHFNVYIPVNPYDSVYIKAERKGDNNGFIMVMGYDNGRIPQFILWVNSTDYFKKNLKHEEDVVWEKLHVECFIPEKTEELRIYIMNGATRGYIDTISFRNLEVEIKKSDIKF